MNCGITGNQCDTHTHTPTRIHHNPFHSLHSTVGQSNCHIRLHMHGMCRISCG